MDERADAGQIAAHYDRLDPLYREVWGEQLHHGLWCRGDESPEQATGAMISLVGDRLELESDQSLCDVGCGYGGPAHELARRFDVRVTGITLSPKQVARASRSRDGRVRVRLGDWLRNDLPDRSFDRVLAIESLAHMPDPALAIAEMARVVRPGGRVVLCCWLRTAHARAWERRWLLGPIRRHGQLPGMATEEMVGRWMVEAGLEPVSAEDFSLQVERTWSVCIRRSAASFFTRAAVRRLMLDRPLWSGALALTLLRIRAAYALGVLRYVVFIARRPE